MGPKTLAAHMNNFAKVARYCGDSEMEKRCNALAAELDGAKRVTAAQEREGGDLAGLAVKRLDEKGAVATLGQLPPWWNS